MHYKNGREAKEGDRVVNLVTGTSGIVYDLNTHSGTCNGRLTALSPNAEYVTVGDCLHLDDVRAASEIPRKE